MSSVLDESIDTSESSFAAVLSRIESESAALLALDIGSSGVRAALFDETARELTRAVKPIRHYEAYLDAPPYGQERLVTNRADVLLNVVTAVIDELLDSLPSDLEIELIAISCFWHSLVGVDSSGSATTPILNWSDTRGSGTARDLRQQLSEIEVHRRTGCRLHPSYWPAKLLWLKTEQSNQFSATTRWLSFSEYLTHHLFDETAISISMASGTGLLNQGDCTWDSSLLDHLGISADQLPLISSESITSATLRSAYAARWPQLRHARLCPAIGDGAANNIGAGCTTSDKLALMIGTSGAARVVYEDEPPAEIPSALWCYRLDRRRAIIGGALSDGGGLFERLREMWAPGATAEELSEQLSQLGSDAHGLTVLPFWAGERSTNWAPNASGGIIGLTTKTTPADVLRAAMESIAYRFALIIQAVQKLSPVSTIVASGNALHESHVWTQIIADVLGQPVMLSSVREASTRGAALLALEAAGKIQLNKQSISECERVFEPDLSRHAKYQAAIERQEKFYNAVAWMFQ